MTLSDIEQVSWKLNDLLEAGKKAKAFASVAPEDGTEERPSAGGFALTTYSTTDQEDEAGKVVAEELPFSDEDSEIIDIPDIDKEDLISVEQASPSLSDEEQLRALEESDPYKQRMQAVHDKAFKEGYTKGLEEGEAGWHDSIKLLNEFVEKMRTASEDKTQLFEPLKKLSLHIAKHLVRGELSVSGLAIERLVLESLNLIEKNTKGVITVYLSPNDRKLYGEVAAVNDRLDLQEDPSLSSGSLRLAFEESAVEDLIEDRLSSLSKLILDQSDGWKVKAEDSELLSTSPNVELDTEIVSRETRVDPVSSIEEEKVSGLGELIEDGEILTTTQDADHTGDMVPHESSFNEPRVESAQKGGDSAAAEDTSRIDNNL